MFRIGDFSRLARVTIKTLHHYDEAGLLQPSHVDPQSGYRYYTAAQLETLQRILLLKDLGFALEQIRELLNADADTWARTLDRRQAELTASIAADGVTPNPRTQRHRTAARRRARSARCGGLLGAQTRAPPRSADARVV
jgi:DNA-binding transcriptional MerR regulator